MSEVSKLSGIYTLKKINISLFIKNTIRLQKTLGVPCAEKYPLNLMQLVLPKGKVRSNSCVVFSFLIQAIPIVVKNQKEWK